MVGQDKLFGVASVDDYLVQLLRLYKILQLFLQLSPKFTPRFIIPLLCCWIIILVLDYTKEIGPFMFLPGEGSQQVQRSVHPLD